MSRPPKLALKILIWLLRDDLVEEVIGDLEEKFYASLKNSSSLRTKLNYWYQVAHYLRPFAIRKLQSTQSNVLGMYQSYFKFGWRNLLKNRGYSAINIGGLALGLACCILIGLYTWDEYNYDRFHSNYKNIFRVVDQQFQADEIYNVAVTPGPLAGALKSDFPEIENVCRIGKLRSNGILKIDDKAFEPHDVITTDNSFFTVFDFILILGNSQRVLS